MGEPLLNVTLTPGDVLYIPRAFFHHTSTHPATLDAPEFIGDRVGDREAAPPVADGERAAIDAQPSMALTISVLCEDVFNTWIFLLGEALQEVDGGGGGSRAAEAEAAVRAVRRVAARTAAAGEDDVGSRLREALPRAVSGGCGRSEQLVFMGAADRWRGYAMRLLAEAVAADGPTRALPAWLRDESSGAPLAMALEAVLRRKRLPCAAKLEQIEAMRDALDGAAVGGGQPLSGAPLDAIDVDGIFKIEKRDKSYLPRDRNWFNARQWT